MENKKERVKIPYAKPPELAPESLGCTCPWGIPENKFPCMDRCFRQSADAPDGGYETVCPYCGIWTSLPEGAALKVTHIFDCIVCGYGKRMTEGDK